MARSSKSSFQPHPHQPPQALLAVVPHRDNPPSHEQIARRAFEIFIERGGEHGRHDEDWAQAVRELSLKRS